MRNSTIKIKFAPCVECCKGGDKSNKYLAHGRLGLCTYHNNLRKVKAKGGTLKKSTPKPKSQEYLELYREIWNERPHVSEVSGEPVPEFDVSCFMHLLNKNTFARFKHDKRNIFLVKKEEHHHYDNVGREDLKSDPKWGGVFHRRFELLREAYGVSVQSE